MEQLLIAANMTTQAAGMSADEYIEYVLQEESKATAATKRQAAIAKALAAMRRKKRRH